MLVIKKDPAATECCPECREKYGYYWFSGMGDLAPHFYCDQCSNVYHRELHREMLRKNEHSQELLDEIASMLPSCPCGGRFRPDQFPKCPHCQHEFREKKDPIWRLGDPYAILVEGASLLMKE